MSEHGEITIDNARYGVQPEHSGCGQLAFNMGVLAVVSVAAIVLLWVTG